MPKAACVLAALKRDGWVEVQRKGSHRPGEGGRRPNVGLHDGFDLGKVQMAQVARAFGSNLDDLRRLGLL
jgi:predicted RNA binding protein YcfA (HicA-like mRNA interferase family)